MLLVSIDPVLSIECKVGGAELTTILLFQVGQFSKPKKKKNDHALHRF